MKKFFSVLGGCFVLIIVIAGISLAIFIPRALRLDREATDYINETLPKVVSPWNSAALLDHSSTELVATLKSPDDIQNLFAMFQKLGALKHLDAPTGSVSSMAFTGKGSGTFGNYVVHAEFEAGPASINIQLQRVGESWKINGFHVNSRALFEKKPDRSTST